MKEAALSIFIIFLFAAGAYFFFFNEKGGDIISPVGRKVQEIKEKPLEKYAFENLKSKQFDPGIITIGQILKDEKDYSSYMFYYTVDSKKVSGLLNIPKKEGVYPLIVMFRGYIDREKYSTGDGTKHAGEVFAQAGFITLAPDFLGYGQSDPPSTNPIEERLQTYTTALTLLASIKNISQALSPISTNIKVDPEKVGIWGHSNGGQISLSVLEISGKNYPTVLWAPVSKPFPYSILYYTDDFDDHGKMLRKVVADFEKDYDVEKYSLTNFFDWIEAPIQLHQGSQDEAVPQKWSDDLAVKFKDLNKGITYFTYPGEDHNFSKGNWSTVVSRNTAFYRLHFGK
ncbi:dienelactone hydrolase family protein [Candidatus Microgenomates bacterium]|nr:dienelactone hydrolase family protein [Candidatus Microgenomates bacterium]